MKGEGERLGISSVGFNPNIGLSLFIPGYPVGVNPNIGLSIFIF